MTEGMAPTEGALELAAELGLDISEIEGTGQEGRVTKEDVEKAARARRAAEQEATAADKTDEAAGGPEEEGEDAGEARFLAFANPDLGTHSVKAYEGGDPNAPRAFYRNPSEHPEGPDAQMVTEEEFGLLNFDVGGVPALARKGE